MRDIGLTLNPLYISHIIQLTPHELSAESKNFASAEALTVGLENIHAIGNISWVTCESPKRGARGESQEEIYYIL